MAHEATSPRLSLALAQIGFGFLIMLFRIFIIVVDPRLGSDAVYGVDGILEVIAAGLLGCVDAGDNSLLNMWLISVDMAFSLVACFPTYSMSHKYHTQFSKFVAHVPTYWMGAFLSFLLFIFSLVELFVLLASLIFCVISILQALMEHTQAQAREEEAKAKKPSKNVGILSKILKLLPLPNWMTG